MQLGMVAIFCAICFTVVTTSPRTAVPRRFSSFSCSQPQEVISFFPLAHLCDNGFHDQLTSPDVNIWWSPN